MALFTEEKINKLKDCKKKYLKDAVRNLANVYRSNPERFKDTIENLLRYKEDNLNYIAISSLGKIVSREGGDRWIIKKLKELSKHSDWRVREYVASAIKDINDNRFKELYDIWKDWLNNSEDKVRRAAIVGLLRIDKPNLDSAYNLVGKVLNDNSKYVQKACSFVLSHLGNRDPSMYFKKIMKWSQKSSIILKEIIAKSMDTFFGKNYPQKCIEHLNYLIEKEENSSLKNKLKNIRKSIINH